MSCDGGHLGFQIGIKNRNLVKDIAMIILYSLGSVTPGARKKFLTFNNVNSSKI
jgi:hypothetical protein